MNERSEPIAGHASAPKEDPETLVLRARPAKAVRFRRGMIVGLAALTSVSVVGTAWLALRPSSFRIVAAADERSDPATAPRDALAGLPASYGEVPKLGPPLPGDLGKPILDHHRETGLAPAVATSTSDPAAEQRAIEQARLAEAKAAAQSGVLVKTATVSQVPLGTATGPTVPATISARAAIDLAGDPNAQGRKLAFLSDKDSAAGINPHAVTPAAPNSLVAGSVVAASLITGLRSDLPGLVVAQVTERVFDSRTGQILLIPQGARLIGKYDSVVAYGQRRALVVWQRIVFPDGSSLALDNVPATDPSGYAGLADKVDFHTWTLLKSAALSTLLGVGTGLSFSGESDLVQAIRESSQQNAARAGDQLVARGLQVQPTITVRPGAAVRLVVHRDLILSPWRE